MQLFDRDAAAALPGDLSLRDFLATRAMWFVRCIAPDGGVFESSSFIRDWAVEKGHAAIQRNRRRARQAV
jgi:hypothetical protein